MRTAVLLVALLVPSAAQAAYFDTGNDYWALCASNPTGWQGSACIATAGAFLDMTQALGYPCSVDGVTRGQAKDVLLKYLAEHPAHRNSPAALLATFAFADAFQCKRQ
jgi:hypothetical protein